VIRKRTRSIDLRPDGVNRDLFSFEWIRHEFIRSVKLWVSG
jgi:hypothetical protein